MVPTAGSGRQKRVRDEAAAWHVRMMEPTSEAEVAAFEQWLQADAAHAQAYDQVQSISSLGARLPHRLLRGSSAPASPRLRPAFGLALVVVCLLAAGLWVTNPAAEPAYAAVSNPGPSVRAVRLKDGTHVILDAGTDLAIAFGEDARNVRILAGRARFAVAPDDDRPFSVAAPAATVIAADSMFDVEMGGDGARIYVAKGDLAVAELRGRSLTAPIPLKAGEAVSVRDGRLERMTIGPREARWPASRLGFDETPLATIVTLANRGGGRDIELRDEAIGTLKVTGVLDIRDTPSLARKLAATHDLQIEESGGPIMLTR